MKKLRYENEKLFKDHETLKTKLDQSRALNDESYRKKIKSLTGELEMFDAFTESFYHLSMSVPQLKLSGKKELGKIRANLTDSIGYMREICNDCSLGVPKGKRVQR